MSAIANAIATSGVTEKKLRASPQMLTTADRSTIHNFFRRTVAFESTSNRETRSVVVEALEFPIRINRPGSVKASATARANYYREEGDPGPPGRPYTQGTAALAIVLLDPDGQQRDAVTMTDLDRDRDARGIIHPREWTLKIPRQELDDIAGFITRLTVVQTLVEAERPSLSANPLLQRTGVLRQAVVEEFRFDLYRLGRLTAALSSPANGVSMTLTDPAGSVVATGTNGRLTADIQPWHLKNGRPAGSTRPPLWKLELSRPASVPPPAQGWTLLAEVHGTLRIPVSVLESRLNKLLGPAANPNFTVAFERHDDTHKNWLGLTLKDGDLAETLGIHNALKGLDPALNPGADLYDYQVGRKYVLLESQIDGDVGPGGVIDWWLEAKNLQTNFISLRVGQSSRFPGLPAILLEARTAGSLEVHIDSGLPNAHFALPVVRGELAFRIEGGRIQAEHWIDPASIQGDGVVGKAVLALAVVKEKLKTQYSAIDAIAERIFQFFMGGRFTFTAARWAADAFEFDYVAGVEVTRTSSPGYMPRGKPSGKRLPNWTSPNLSKVDHIVVLMMENRSFDHMLGSLALANPNVDGLTPAVMQSFNAPGHTIRSLAEAAFPVITQFPLSVGHGYADVSQQMTGGMKGFVENFKAHHQADLDAARCKADDVLGYYPIAMLPTYEFLAREYAVCDRFFCSHPGPTLPNRMYSLTGELQRTLYGEPRLENGVDRNMTLSRDPTIFDILDRHAIKWRQYESPPSVAMLRFFARYAGEDDLIRGIGELKDDVRNNRLRSVTFIDPQMHAVPVNDDHAPFNLLHGQQLVRDVYDALTSNPAVWSKTLLVVSYDEHGGFFDHVVPVTAEALPKRNADPLVVSYGVRVPGFLVSPWVPRGGVVKQTLDFTSILKTILVRFCAADQPFLSDRVNWAEDLGPALSLTQPRPLPANPPVVPLAESDKAAAAAPRAAHENVPMSELTRDDADWHDFMGVLGRAVRP